MPDVERAISKQHHCDSHAIFNQRRAGCKRPKGCAVKDGDKGLRAIRITDPCFYCGRALADVTLLGCGSQERGFDQKALDRICEVVRHADPLRGGKPPRDR